MPLRGRNHSKLVGNEAPYFDSLAELDKWTPSSRLSGVLSYVSRSAVGDLSENRGKLLVCHDYKGGYTERPSAQSYTFNFWSSCDTFVYFSHHRVTVPPSGWITAAHRQGVKILGTLIFEGSGEEDCLRLLVGHLPKSKTGPALASTTSLPLSPHYARLLADLAQQRGFDGYLLNFECPLKGGIEQTRALAAWNTLLQSELQKKIGLHAQTVWYDSVIFTGHLRWQDRLNSLNLPFFLSASSIFTNYTWPPNYPTLTAQYFLSIDPTHLTKTLRDIFMGVDVWGRGSHGNGGFGSYKAISHIDPEFLGLSVALFGQAWTWESEQDKPGWTWEKWWDYERKLWVGPAKEGEVVDVPEARDAEPKCPHGPFVPIASFFPRSPPPNPEHLALHTSFCPGVGRAWFVEGVQVLESEDGWTDVDKQCTLGDMLWPRPVLAWEGDERTEKLPDAASVHCTDDAWNGGSCLRLSFSGSGSDADDAFFRCVWVPIQSLSITPRRSYEASVVYKKGADDDHIDLDLGVSVKLLSGSVQQTVDVTPAEISYSDLAEGWSRLSIQFVLPTEHPHDVQAAIGLVIGFAAEDPSVAYNFSLLLGQLNIYPSRPTANVSVHQPKIIWADFQRSSSLITWEVAASFAPLTSIDVSSPEDPTPAWTLDSSGHWFPSFIFFNIYVKVYSADGSVLGPSNATFIGTTGLDGHANRFFVDRNTLPATVQEGKDVRFYVQGVTDHGEVLPWEQCVFVDTRW